MKLYNTSEVSVLALSKSTYVYSGRHVFEKKAAGIVLAALALMLVAVPFVLAFIAKGPILLALLGLGLFMPLFFFGMGLFSKDYKRCHFLCSYKGSPLEAFLQAGNSFAEVDYMEGTLDHALALQEWGRELGLKQLDSALQEAFSHKVVGHEDRDQLRDELGELTLMVRETAATRATAARDERAPKLDAARKRLASELALRELSEKPQDLDAELEKLLQEGK